MKLSDFKKTRLGEYITGVVRFNDDEDVEAYREELKALCEEGHDAVCQFCDEEDGGFSVEDVMEFVYGK